MIFIDADAFVAIASPSDSNHGRAVLIARSLKQRNEVLITSSFVFGEVVTVLSQKEGRKVALSYIDDFSTSGIALMEVDTRLREKGIIVFKKQTSKNVSFTDCVSMVIMQEENIKEIFSFDRIYQKNGFTLLQNFVL